MMGPYFKINRVVLLALLVVMATIGLIVNDLYVASLSSIPDALGVSPSVAKLTATIYFLSFSFSQLVYGPLSDRFGRRLITLWGFFFGALGTAVCYWAGDISVLFSGRAMQGLGLSACVVMYRSVLRDVFPNRRYLSRNASYIMMMIGLIMIVSLVLGGYIRAHGTWQSIFGYLLIYQIVAFIVTFILLPETQKKSSSSGSIGSLKSSYMRLLTTPSFIYAASIAGLAFGSFSVYFTASPFVLRNDLGLGALPFSYSCAAVALGLSLGSFTNSIFVVRFGVRAMLLFGIVVMALSSIAMLLAHVLGHFNVYVIVIPALIFMWGEGVAFENATATALAPFSEIAGLATACFGFVQLMGATLMTFILSVVTHRHGLPMMILMTIASLIMVKLALKIQGKPNELLS